MWKPSKLRQLIRRIKDEEGGLVDGFPVDMMGKPDFLRAMNKRFGTDFDWIDDPEECAADWLARWDNEASQDPPIKDA